MPRHLGGPLLLVFLLLSTGAVPAPQDKSASYEEELRNGDAYLQRRMFEPALQAYKHAHSLSDKSSYDALVGMALAYRGLGAHKNVLDMCGDGLKLAGDDKVRQAQIHNLRGAALVALSDKPNDKKLQDAEAAFRAALAANESFVAARQNLGIALLKMGRDLEGVRELKAYVETAPKGVDVENARKMIEDPRRAREPFSPEFSFTSKDGEYIALEDLAGKTVLLDFWGSWCAPCVASTPVSSTATVAEPPGATEPKTSSQPIFERDHWDAKPGSLGVAVTARDCSASTRVTLGFAFSASRAGCGSSAPIRTEWSRSGAM